MFLNMACVISALPKRRECGRSVQTKVRCDANLCRDVMPTQLCTPLLFLLLFRVSKVFL